MKAAVLSPHLDDAVLSCWHLLEERDDVAVVNVFTGSPPAGTPPPPWDILTGGHDPVARMRERRAEDRRALALVGRDAVHLDLLDVQYDGRPRSVSRLADRFATLLDPDTVLYAPAGIDGHPDHELVRDAALELARGGRRLVIYADLPHAIGRGWPDWVTGVPRPPGVAVAAEWAEVLAGAGLITERLVPRVRPLDAGMRARKLRALAEYRTQRAAIDGLAFVSLEDPRALAFEVSWAVPASAHGGAHESRGEVRLADRAREPLHDRR